ncbi:MAG: InlB B-repeat-containing protein, partial [Myxococcota bacterium]
SFGGGGGSFGGGGGSFGGGGGSFGGGGGSFGGGGGSTSFNLTVALLGNGAGTVLVSPPGLSCNTSCTVTYTATTGVTLTATPVSGSTFAGWSGGCTGTSPTCSLTLSGATTVTAAFVPSATGGGGGTTTMLGNYTPLPNNSSHSANYLLGNRITVPSTVSLSKFGVIGRAAGPSVIMALYTDAGGAPGSLVARTASTPLIVGNLELSPLSATTLVAGTYWIMAEYSSSASIGTDSSVSTNFISYVSHTFGTTLPNPFGAPQTYDGSTFNYYLVVQ